MEPMFCLGLCACVFFFFIVRELRKSNSEIEFSEEIISIIKLSSGGELMTAAVVLRR